MYLYGCNSCEMGDTLKKIYDIAVSEVPKKVHHFQKEKAVLYKGFKISKTLRGYKWEDIRYNDYYETVDPIITDKILENGFIKTLDEVMEHSDKRKIVEIDREVCKLTSDIAYWVTESSKAYAEYNKKLKNGNLDSKEKRIFEKRYNRQRELFHKKRRVLAEERETLLADKRFYESRLNQIKLK